MSAYTIYRSDDGEIVSCGTTNAEPQDIALPAGASLLWGAALSNITTYILAGDPATYTGGQASAKAARPAYRARWSNDLMQWVDIRTPEQVNTELQAEIVKATQARLDAFAQTRNYDGILSACTYATSSVPTFAAEGQYCVTARDGTWAALYVILGEVTAGTRPMPGGYSDIDGDLPVLGWPSS
jgi:hypothetical protein